LFEHSLSVKKIPCHPYGETRPEAGSDLSTYPWLKIALHFVRIYQVQKGSL